MRRDPLPLRLLDGVDAGLNVTGSVLILGLMVLIGMDVAGRNFLDASLPGVPEMVSLSIVAIVFLQSPQTLRAERMPRSTVLADLLAARRSGAARLLEDVWDVLGVLVLGVIVWAVWPKMVHDWKRGTFVGADLAGEGHDRCGGGVGCVAIRGADLAPSSLAGPRR
ncbi:MAG: TRAP transporter small permease [Pseudomonadota bacterium]